MLRPAAVIVVASAVLLSLSSCSSEPDGPGRDAAVPATTRIQVILGLRRDDAGLARAVRASSDPSSASYGHHLTAAQVARRYGASAADRRRVLDVLDDAGVRGTVTASGGAVVAPMTAEQVHDVFGQWPQHETGADGATIASTVADLAVPSSLRGAVTQVVGGRSTITAGRAPDAGTVSATPDCGSSSAGPGGPTALGAWYGYDDHLFRDDQRGQGRRVGLLAIGRWSPASLDAFAQCYRTRPTGAVRVRPAPATPTNVAVGPEVTLDVIVAASFAPEAAIDVFQYDRYGSIAAGLLQAVDANATGAPLDALSTSIGYCEQDLGRPEIAVSEHALLALAAMGTTVLASSGDTGSASCLPDRTTATVQYPASSPWITGVGGTTVQGSGGTITSESVWSSPGTTPPQAGGGGSSRRFTRPWFQRSLDPSGARPGRRLVPDVAYLADPALVPPIPICPTRDDCSWYRLGGTSAPAPALAAVLALGSQDLTDRHAGAERFGLLAPLAGRLAHDDPAGIHDVTEGSNRVLGLTCCDAGPGYDLASGWGSVRLPELVDLAASRAG